MDKNELDNKREKTRPQVGTSPNYGQKHKELKTYSIYLIGGQMFQLKAFGYQYTWQFFFALNGKYGEELVVGLIDFWIPFINKKGEKGKSKTSCSHFVKFNDVSAIILEDEN